MRKQLVRKMAIEKNTLSAEYAEEWYTCRKLVYKENIVLSYSGTKECQGEMKLAGMRKENVEFATPCARKG